MPSAMRSRLCKLYAMPSVPLLIPSLTPMELKRSPTFGYRLEPFHAITRLAFDPMAEVSLLVPDLLGIPCRRKGSISPFEK